MTTTHPTASPLSIVSLGLEAEALIVDEHLHIHAGEHEVPTTQWLIEEAIDRHPGLRNHLDDEELSGQLEIKTGIHSSIDDVIKETFHIRHLLNEVAKDIDARVIFRPLPLKPQVSRPANTNPTTRAHELIARWADDQKKLDALISSGMQPNIGVLVPSINKKDHTLALMNALSDSREALWALNIPELNHMGRSRIEVLEQDLLHLVKANGMVRHGFHPMHATRPPHLPSTEAYRAYQQAHGDGGDKDTHTLTGKIKSSLPQDHGIADRHLLVVEGRATDTTEEIARIRTYFQNYLAIIADSAHHPCCHNEYAAR